MAAPFQELSVVHCRRGRRRPSKNKTDSSVYCLPKKRDGLHALLITHQFQGSVTGHVGGVWLALDHSSYKGSFNKNAHGRSDLRRRFANPLFDQSSQKLAESLLVP